MQDLIWDAVPTQRKKKEEQFDVAVVTMSALEKLGAGRKFIFNKAAQTFLGIQGEDRVSFGFQLSTKSIFIKKVDGEAGFKLTKTCTLSDKRTYEFIAKMLDLNTQIESHFLLKASDAMEGVSQMNFMPIISAEESEEEVFDILEENELYTMADTSMEVDDSILEEAIAETEEEEIEEIEAEDEDEEGVW